MGSDVELTQKGTSFVVASPSAFGGQQSQAPWRRIAFGGYARAVCLAIMILLCAALGLWWILRTEEPPQGTPPPPRASKHVAVAIRTHSPLPGMLNRFKEIAEDLTNNYPDAYFVISIDTSKPPGKPGWKNCVQTVKETVPEGTLLHVYDWSNVETKFPGWIRERHTCKDPNPLKDVKHRVGGWNFHAEAISLIYQFLRENTDMSSDAQIWILEDDIYFCGGPNALSAIMTHYKYDQHDLLFYPKAYPVKNPLGPHWWQTECCSPGFKKFYDVDHRYQCPEHVQRFSSRFLDHLDDIMIKNDTHGWSEMFAVTVCLNNKKYHCGHFNDQDVGDYSWDNTFKEKEVKDSCRKQAGRITMNHAAKFFQENSVTVI